MPLSAGQHFHGSPEGLRYRTYCSKSTILYSGKGMDRTQKNDGHTHQIRPRPPSTTKNETPLLEHTIYREGTIPYVP